MPKTVPVEVRIADLPQMKQVIGSVAALIRTLAECGDLLPAPVMAAADQLRRDVAALGGRDIGPPPDDDPGRIITR